MSYEFTKLSEVPAVSKFPEGANTIIETNGEIKRCLPSNTPKPLTYDYMPEGYPKKTVQTAVLMEEQEVAFALNNGKYLALITDAFEVVKGQTYTVNWDGTEYECVCYAYGRMTVLGNLSIMAPGDDTGEPFIYVSDEKAFATADTSASHTISVKTAVETVTPMADEFLPATALITGSILDNTFSSEFTNNELYAMLLDGKQIMFYHTDANENLYLTKWKKSEAGRIDLAFAGEPDYSVSLYPNGTIGSVPTA